MSRNVVMIPREMSLQGAARMLARAGVTGAPVVDGAGRCIGVLSATDFMNWMKTEPKPEHESHASEAVCKPWQIPEAVEQETGCVESCMTKDPVLAFANVKIGEMAGMMMDAHIHRIIIVDSVSQRPIGVVSSIDILAALARAHRIHEEENPPAFGSAEDTLLGM